MQQEAITMIAVGKLKLADDNVRDELGDIAEFAASMKSVGVLEPLIVREDGLLVVCGTRRLHAAKHAGLKDVPVILGSFTDEERITLMAVENLQRQSLSPLEEARVFQRLSDLDLTTRQVASRVGVSQSWVVKRLSLLKLPEAAQAAVSSGALEISQANELVKIADDPMLVEKLVKKAEGGSKHTALDVQHALEARDRAKAAKAKEKELENEGEKTVVPLVDEFYKAVPSAGMKLVHPQAFGAVRMLAEEHAKLPCHAVGVHPRTAEVLEVCINPGAHPDPETERQVEDEKRKQQLVAQKERERLEHQHRIDFLKAAAVKPSKEIVLDVCYRALAEDTAYSYSDGSVALALLGIDIEVEDGSELDESEEQERKLLELAKTPAGRLRVTFAFAVDRLYGQGNVEAVLDDLGYTPPKAVLEVVAA